MQRETKSARPCRSVASSTCWRAPAGANSAVTGGGVKFVVPQLLRSTRQTIAAAKIAKRFNFINRYQKLCALGDPAHPPYQSLARERRQLQTNFDAGRKHLGQQRDFLSFLHRATLERQVHGAVLFLSKYAERSHSLHQLPARIHLLGSRALFLPILLRV